MITHEKLKYVINMQLKADLISFVKRGFEELNPAAIYVHNWHIDEICENLIEVYLQNKTRLIVTMPPRYLKSVSISVCFAAWILGLDPSKRIIVASYSQSLANKHSLDTKKIMQSNWYKELFPETRIIKGQSQKSKFVTTAGGFRLATSTGGSLTGEGGDILIVDDPHKPSTINSKLQREKVAEWFENTFLSRLNNKKTGGIVIVMQRLHEEDLVGMLMKKDSAKWCAVNFKAISEEMERKRDYGVPLHERRESLEDLYFMKQEMGEREFNAQYQQTPNNLGQSLFKKDWIKTVSDCQIKPSELIVLSIDSASKISASADFTAISVWIVRGESEVILIDLIREKLEFGDLLKCTKNTILKYNPKFVIIEDKSSGIALIQELKKTEFSSLIVPFKVRHEKLTRFLSVLNYFERELVKISDSLTLIEELKHELTNFPSCQHDDMVDSIVNFLTWHESMFKKNPRSAPAIRFL